VKHCHAYTEDTTSVVMDALMGSAISQEEHYDDYEGWCQYPLGEFLVLSQRKTNYLTTLIRMNMSSFKLSGNY